MWYVAHLMFAQKPAKGRRRVLCESCQVLFRAPSALKCYNRALAWAKTHEQEGAFRFVGVEHIKSLDDERPDDGAELGGRFYNAYDVWLRKKAFIPKKEDIPAVRWETQRNAPLGEMMTPKQKQVVRKFFKGQ